MSPDLLEWSDRFNTGITGVDAQHRKLVELLNRLHRAIQNRQSKEVSRQILDELTDYTRTHFRLEEGLMQASRYADFAAHKKMHEDLIAQVVALQAKLDSGTSAIGFELLHFLKTWLVRHISETDKRFGAYYVLTGKEEAAAEAAAMAEAMAATAATEDRRPWWRPWKR
jgi:hemerythrin